MNGVILPAMKEKKVRILGIAPYTGMKSTMEHIARERADLKLDVYVGDLDQGVHIALNNIQSNYDIMISRGGTASLLEKESSLPVVTVEISTYDILRTIKLCENYSQPLAIVGFPNVTANAHILCGLMQYTIDIYTIHSRDEASDTLHELKRNGYGMILCDMITYTTAQKMEMNAILITSGPESISTAFDQAVAMYKTYRRMMAEGRFYQDIIRDSSQKVLVMKDNGEIIFTTVKDEQLSVAVELLTPEIPEVIARKVTKFFKNIDQTLYSCICRSMEFSGHSYAVFYLSSSSVPIISGKYGIQYSSQKEIEDVFFNNIYNVTDVNTDKLNEVSYPVLLTGEPGTGKEQAARMIYSRSLLKGNPLITISCGLLNERSWSFLVNHYNSPFNDNNNTIFLKNINALSKERYGQLLSTIIDTSLCKRNRVIFSCDSRPGQTVPKEMNELVNLLSCVTYFLKPTRERAEDIPTLCALYLNSANLSMENQIIGLEPEALTLLQEYSWPYNYTQFRRILSELTLITDTPYISAHNVKMLLEKELEIAGQAAQPVSDSDSALNRTLNLDKPLSEITIDIIHKVLEAYDGNQSAAAKHLKIGRSTLWRYLK